MFTGFLQLLGASSSVLRWVCGLRGFEALSPKLLCALNREVEQERRGFVSLPLRSKTLLCFRAQGLECRV